MRFLHQEHFALGRLISLIINTFWITTTILVVIVGMLDVFVDTGGLKSMVGECFLHTTVGSVNLVVPVIKIEIALFCKGH